MQKGTGNVGSRHGVIHRFELDYELDRKKIEDVFDTIRLLMDTLIDTLERDKGLQIRDGLVWSNCSLPLAGTVHPR